MNQVKFLINYQRQNIEGLKYGKWVNFFFIISLYFTLFHTHTQANKQTKTTLIIKISAINLEVSSSSFDGEKVNSFESLICQQGAISFHSPKNAHFQVTLKMALCKKESDIKKKSFSFFSIGCSYFLQNVFIGIINVPVFRLP